MRPGARHVRSGEAGISLLEVLIGIIIISLMGSMLMVAIRTSVAGQSRSKVYGDAATATKEVLESIQLLGLDSLSRLDGAGMPHSQGPGVTVKATARGVAPGDVHDIAALDTATLRHLTLITEFRNQAGGKVRKAFSTILYKP